MSTHKEKFELALMEEARWLLKGIKPSDPPTDFDKYTNVDFEVPYKFKMVKALGLHEEVSQDILDISTCAGWMSWILTKLCHNLTYTDYLDFEVPLIKEIRKRLGLHKCVDHHYERIGNDRPMKFKFVPLPEDIGKFDVIMANSVQPHGYFTAEMWVQFIEDCMLHLNKDGYMYISPNHSEGWNRLWLVQNDFKSEKILEGWRIYNEQ